MGVESIRSRMIFDVDRRALRRYVAGDVTAIVLFVILGELSHGENLPEVLWPMVQTLVTFLVGWFAVATLGGAYAAKTRTDRRRAVVVPVVLWAFADAIAQALRSTTVFQGDAAITFYLVALVVGGALIGGWRYFAFRRWGGRRTPVT